MRSQALHRFSQRSKSFFTDLLRTSVHVDIIKHMLLFTILQKALGGWKEYAGVTQGFKTQCGWETELVHRLRGEIRSRLRLQTVDWICRTFGSSADGWTVEVETPEPQEPASAEGAARDPPSDSTMFEFTVYVLWTSADTRAAADASDSAELLDTSDADGVVLRQGDA